MSKKNLIETRSLFCVKMDCSKDFWKKQLHIAIANTIPFVGPSILEFITENKIEQAYQDLITPSWAPESFWVRLKIK